MKKNFCLLLMPFILSGCALVNYKPDSNTSSHQGEESKEESETTSETHKDSGGGSEVSENYPQMKGDHLLLNPYGDYVISNEANVDLLDTYNKLTKKVTSDADGVFQTSYQKGLLEFFNYQNKVDVSLNISRKTLEDLDYDHSTGNRESFRMCSADITYIGLTFHYEEVGIRQKGNTSRGFITDGDNINTRHYKLSFEETFDDEYVKEKKVWNDQDAYEYRQDRDFFGLSKIDIRWNRNFDSTYMREFYAFEMYRANGGMAARTNPIHFSMNVEGETYNHGVYLAVETITNSFIKRNFVKNARGGDLYKLSWGSGQGAKFNPVSDNFFGVETLHPDGDHFWQESFTYELKTNETTSHHEVIKEFISVLNDQHGNTAYEFANQYLDYNRFLTYSAISYLLGDPDDLRGNYNNSYVYFYGDSNQMIIIPIDNDRVLGATGGAGSNPTGHHGALSKPFDKRTGYGGDNDSNLFNKLIFSTNSTTIRPEYLNRIEEVIDSGWMNIDNYEKYYNVISQHYRDDVEISDNVSSYLTDFSLEESSDIYGEDNLSVATYMENKVQTFNNNRG